MDYQAMGRNLRGARKAAGLTQEKLAERIGVSTVFVSQLETGARTPSLDTLAALSRALDTSLDALVFGADADTAARDWAALVGGRTAGQQALALRVVRALLAGLDAGELP